MVWLWLAGCGLLTPSDQEIVVAPDTSEEDPGPQVDGGTSDSGAGGDTAEPDDTGDSAVPWDSSVEDEDYALCINEFMPDNDHAVVTSDGESPDWIELHNPSDVAVSLDHWRIADSRDGTGQHHLDASLSVEAGGYLLLYADDVPEKGADHLGFKLSSDGGEVVLYEPDGDTEAIVYGAVEPDYSVARVPDCCEGSTCLAFVDNGTPGQSNGAAE